MTPTEKHDYLEGQMSGVIVAMQLLLELTPYPDSSRLAIKDTRQGVIGNSKELNANGYYVAGLEAVQGWMTKR